MFIINNYYASPNVSKSTVQYLVVPESATPVTENVPEFWGPPPRSSIKNVIEAADAPLATVAAEPELPPPEYVHVQFC